MDAVRVLGSLISSLSAIPKKKKTKQKGHFHQFFTSLHTPFKSTKFVHQYLPIIIKERNWQRNLGFHSPLITLSFEGEGIHQTQPQNQLI